MIALLIQHGYLPWAEIPPIRDNTSNIQTLVSILKNKFSINNNCKWFDSDASKTQLGLYKKLVSSDNLYCEKNPDFKGN